MAKWNASWLSVSSTVVYCACCIASVIVVSNRIAFFIFCRWLLNRRELWGSVSKTSGARFFQSLAMLMLCLVQILIYFMCLTMPAFIGVVGHLTVSAVGLTLTCLGYPLSAEQNFGLYFFHWVIYGGSWLIHMYVSRFNKVQFKQLRCYV